MRRSEKGRPMTRFLRVDSAYMCVRFDEQWLTPLPKGTGGSSFCHGSTMAVRLFCKQGVVGSTPSRGSILDNSLMKCIKVTYGYL